MTRCLRLPGYRFLVFGTLWSTASTGTSFIRGEVYQYTQIPEMVPWCDKGYCVNADQPLQTHSSQKMPPSDKLMLDLQRRNFEHALAAASNQHYRVCVPVPECVDLSAYDRKERLAAFDP